MPFATSSVLARDRSSRVASVKTCEFGHGWDEAALHVTCPEGMGRIRDDFGTRTLVAQQGQQGLRLEVLEITSP